MLFIDSDFTPQFTLVVAEPVYLGHGAWEVVLRIGEEFPFSGTGLSTTIETLHVHEHMSGSVFLSMTILVLQARRKFMSDINSFSV